jgi:hypothetical protein
MNYFKKNESQSRFITIEIILNNFLFRDTEVKIKINFKVDRK